MLGVKRIILRRETAGEAERLMSPEAMNTLMRRERLRSNRSGSPFALVVFTFETGPNLNEQTRSLTAILRRRLRETDEVGLLDRGRIAALLTDTGSAGALMVAEDVSRLFEPHPPGFDYEVYAYPQRQDDESDSDRHEAPGDPPRKFVHDMESLFATSSPLLKRCLDVVGATIGLILAAPLMLLIATAIRLTTPGPVLFTQKRSGIGGRVFTIYKFRTMRVGADEHQAELRKLIPSDQTAFKLVDDPRLTPIGRRLRSTSMDELPQLWNVLKGDMSLVGPRPLPCHETDACRPWQRRRLDVTPGLTGIWQVNGRSSVAFDQWIRMDMDYIARSGLWLDLQLLLRTIPAVVLRRGAH